MDRAAWEGYNPWGHKELDMTEQLALSLFTFPGDTVDKNPSASAGDMGLIPGPGKMPVSPYTTTTETALKSPQAAITEAHGPRTCALQQEKPPQ